MAKKIYLARHGQTFYNLDDRLGGDPWLTETGIEHAKKVAGWMKDISLDTIYASTLKRSFTTAEIIHAYHPDIPLIRTPELTEINNGDLEGLNYKEFEERHPELFAARQQDKFHWKFPNGESYEDVLERVTPFLEEITGTVAIVGHQGVNRTILGHYLSLPRTEIPYLVTPNDVLFIIDPETKRVGHIREGIYHEGYNVEK